MFAMLYSINWPKFIVWFPLLLKVLDNMCIAIFGFPGCGAITFEINLIFFIKLFFYKNENLNILRTKRAFNVE